MSGKPTTAGINLFGLATSPEDKAEAMELAYDAMDAFDSERWAEAKRVAVAALRRDPFNPWALLLVNDALVAMNAAAEGLEWADAETQAMRLPGILAAIGTGHARVLEKQKTMVPPFWDAWHQVEGRPYAKATRYLSDALVLMGHDDLAATVLAMREG